MKNNKKKIGIYTLLIQTHKNRNLSYCIQCIVQVSYSLSYVYSMVFYGYGFIVYVKMSSY